MRASCMASLKIYTEAIELYDKVLKMIPDSETRCFTEFKRNIKNF